VITGDNGLTNPQTLQGPEGALAPAAFRVLHAQMSLFTPDVMVTSSRLLGTWYPRWAQRFDGEPIVLPGVEGAPREIPRAVFSSRDGTWRCEIAPAQINLHWSRQQPPNDGPEQEAPPMNAGLEVLTDYQQALEARVGRVALILTRAAPHPHPAMLLARHFCRDRWLEEAPLNRPESFELHAHKTFSLGGQTRVNSWVRNKSAFVGTPAAPQPVVVVEQDLNTLAEVQDTTALSESQIGRFFELARPEMDLILRLYYPAEEAR
jgi:hypothetical protein